ncbi:MAG: AmmeMemoRadiSam system protein B [bacterium]|nr:AmmeMemoRadiSam system protein B [bacterium]
MFENLLSTKINALTVVIVVVLILLSCKGGKKVVQVNTKNVFNSRLSKIGWYTDDKTELAAEIEQYLDNAKGAVIDNIQALILPHAGYSYSGQVAAYGINQIRGKKYKRVFVIGPSHSTYLHNRVSIPDVTHYSTPLGEIPLDTKVIKKLLKKSEFVSILTAHNSEHSVQIELPFLQQAIDDFKLIPVVVGSFDRGGVIKIASYLNEFVDEETLVVVSSDFVHYGSRFGYQPFYKNVPENIEKLDMDAIEFIKNKNAQGFKSYCERTSATICGRGPIELLLTMTGKDSEVHLLKYDTSGSLTGDWSNSVSYAALAISGKLVSSKEGKNMSGSVLSGDDKQSLLLLARRTAEYYLKNGVIPGPEQLNIKITDPVKEVMGAFVTLHKAGALRGCIGEIMPERALYKAVMHQSVNSIVNDNRFNPVDIDELKDLKFEISALTAPFPVPSYKDIVLGKHGIIMQKSGRSAVFLPQVATEQGWTVEETLSNLSMKAGLNSNSWEAGAQFFVFEAIVFSEK